MTMQEMISAGATAPAQGNEGGSLALRVTAIRYLAETIREIEFRRPDGGRLEGVEAGAHIDLALPGDVSNSYSLVNEPGDDQRFLVAINRDPASRGGSAFLVEDLRVGATLQVSVPTNTFPLADAPRFCFFAGGIGITPILSMIRACAALGTPWELHYAFRAEALAAYLPEVRALAAASTGTLHLHDDALTGAVMEIAPRVAAAASDAHLYCCGPEPMIAAFTEASAARDPEAVHVEHFKNEFEASTESFTVVLKRRGQEFQVPAGRTIMEVLSENGIRVAYSCRSGVCGTCETRVLEGEPDHKDTILSERERASNKVMLICCSGSKSGRLVLDI
ncbi:PDR/VanB family oxidoreductase [Tropicimonas marinistellae]|uniref:PDR/VanB family oxidoreductase n=1 Tax=Tropicimonas marinistellae TaxID=1739787 RepID=UPI00082AD074|nr:PDR/VanB family oxidoreductase [Tropicimonas marinistellae]